MKESVVSVLMSTYNGEQYVREQIESILCQTGVSVQLTVRDDGSADATREILKTYAARYGNVHVYFGQNIGVGKSFLKLLYDAPEADYYAFADQDDIWLPDKLERAVSVLKAAETGEKQPILYTSNQTLVDEYGNILRLRFEKEPIHNLYQTISSNYLFGCTMVINQALQKTMASGGYYPSNGLVSIKFHDAWTAIVANILGQIIYDEESRIYYRQHSHNVVGIKTKTWREKVKDKYARIRSQKYKGVRSRCAREILRKFDQVLGEDDKRKLSCLGYCQSIQGGIRLCRDKELRQVFPESRLRILLRAVSGWI